MTKRRFITPIVALFLCIGLVSVGFAAWVITANGEDTFTEGQFTVHSVSNKSVQISAALGSDNVVNLGASAKSADATYSWLTFNAGTPEDLTFSLNVTITNWSSLKDGNSTITIDAGALAITATGFTNSDYLVTPAAGSVTISKSGGTWTNSTPTATGWSGVTFDSTSGVLTINYTFAWGEAFGEENPINYYNRSAYSEPLALAAETALKALYTLNGQTEAYSISVEATIE